MLFTQPFLYNVSHNLGLHISNFVPIIVLTNQYLINRRIKGFDKLNNNQPKNKKVERGTYRLGKLYFSCAPDHIQITGPILMNFSMYRSLFFQIAIPTNTFYYCETISMQSKDAGYLQCNNNFMLAQKIAFHILCIGRQVSIALPVECIQQPRFFFVKQTSNLFHVLGVEVPTYLYRYVPHVCKVPHVSRMDSLFYQFTSYD